MRNLMRESHSRLRIAEKFPLAQVLNDHRTLLTNRGSLVQVIKIEGKNYSGISEEELEGFFDKRKAFFDNLGHNISVSIYALRKRVSVMQDMVDLGNDYANEVNRLRYEDFKIIYRTELYLAVKLALPTGLTGKLGMTSKNNGLEWEKIHLKRVELESKVSEICKLLESYSPKLLLHQPHYSYNLLDFWSYLINAGKSFPVPPHSQFLGRTIGLTDLEFRQESGVIKAYDIDGERCAAVLGINIYPQETYSAMLDMLMQIRHPFTILQQVIPQDPEETKVGIQKKINSMQSIAETPIVGSTFMGLRMDELAEMGNLVEAGDIRIIQHTLSIFVYGVSEEDLAEGIRKIRSALAPHGLSLIVEKMHMENAFWAQFPDNEPLNEPRRYQVTTHNVSDFVTFATSYEGLDRCAFGNHGVALFKTREDTQFNFTFHAAPGEQAPGHTILIGPTGAGKSVLAMNLLMNCLKFQDDAFGQPLRMLVFDSGQGLKIPVRAFGGEYIDAGNPDKLPMNPLMLEDTQSNRMFLNEWIAMLAGGVDTLSDDDKNLIGRAVDEVMGLPRAERGLGATRSVLLERGKEDSQTLFNRVKRWMPHEQAGRGESLFADFFNGTSDALKFDKRMVGFDMAFSLKNKDILAPLSAYIFHAFNSTVDHASGPHLFFVDEMQQYLQNDIFAPFILKVVREARKRNGVFFGAVQEPGILIHNKNGQAIAENLVTFIVMKNSRARAEEYQMLGFTDREIDWIKTPTSGYEALVKRAGGESVIINTDLKSLGAYLHLFSGKLDDVIRAQQLYDAGPQDWVERFLGTKRERVST
ncbi:MAG: hypothetical protein DI628_00535 [Blastochloris viridis]|uniref:CagE TrbE VirB component of type IV transporter system central domain-containing protein n=1 Tax=Blastochloris viridis TaxID=1079 RepID=A0A6N4R2H7_BLAVI|nr:MAG: hypothetical protein DI628_00535 [Blastochloris viridis]